MGLISRLAETARISTRQIGSLELILSDDLDAFLHAAEVSNIAIIGIEGFDVEGDKVVPDTDAIADFSGLPHDNDRAMLTIGEARLFLQRVSRPGMYFDFEVDDSGDGI